MNKKRNAVEWAMHYRQIIILCVLPCCFWNLQFTEYAQE